MTAREQVQVARELLASCLWDSNPWEPDALVSLMEKVYATLGGNLTDDDPPGAPGENPDG